MSIDWKPFVDLVNNNDSFVLTSHTRPDCDAIGSELAMALGLRSLGKQVRIINGDAPPAHIAFIDPENHVEVLDEGASTADAHAADVHMILDTSAWGQLGPMAEVLRDSPAKRVIIDHHVSGDDLGATCFKDTTAEANGRLVLEALDALGVEITQEIAIPLYAAIATDTGWFRFPSVNEKTYLAVARLVEAGAVPSQIFSSLYDQNTAGRIRLHGRIMSSILLELDDTLAFGMARTEDFIETGALLSDTEDVVNRLLSVAGVKVAVLIAAMEDGLVKVSLRSRSDVDVRVVAEHFGGGGHTKAAGVRYRGTVDEAREAVLAVLSEQMA